MRKDNNAFLSEDNCAMWAKAGATFPGERLGEVITRMLACIPNNLASADIYEIRRADIPSVFDALLKLQDKGYASRHITTRDDEFLEILEIEVSFFDTIMLAIAMLLDLIQSSLTPGAGGDGNSPFMNIVASSSAAGEKPYVPTWKRRPQSIGYDELFK